MAMQFEDEEFPDDFDTAYANFAEELFGMSSGQEHGQEQAVLNREESLAFSEFLDNVLDKPEAAKHEELHFADWPLPNGTHPTTHFVPAGVNELGKQVASFGHFAPRESKANPLLSATTAPPPQPSTRLSGASTAFDGGKLESVHPMAQAHSNISLQSHNAHSPVPSDNDDMNKVSPAPSAKSEFYQGFLQGPKRASVERLIQATVEARESTTQAVLTGSHDPPAPRIVNLSDLKDGRVKKRKEFLSEEQIRQNHISSEKRRRQLISQLFAQMCDLVPAISKSAGSLPKSAVLQTVYDYILQLSEQNNEIRARLENRGASAAHIKNNKLAPPLED